MKDTLQRAQYISDIKEVLSNRTGHLVLHFCRPDGGPLEGFADVWGTAFLKQVYGFEGTVAASLPSMIFIGMCFGAPVLSLIAEKMGGYLATIIGAGLLMAVIFAALLNWHYVPRILKLQLCHRRSLLRLPDPGDLQSFDLCARECGRINYSCRQYDHHDLRLCLSYHDWNDHQCHGRPSFFPSIHLWSCRHPDSTLPRHRRLCVLVQYRKKARAGYTSID